MNCYLGIDVGGMSIKAGIIDDNGGIFYKTKKAIIDNDAYITLRCIVDEVLDFCKENKIAIHKAGIGVPCIYDKKTGDVCYGNNLNFHNVNLKKYFKEKYNIDLNISNDAMVAVMGEHRYGNAKGYDNAVLITIGTGVGCGIILNNKIINSNSSAVGELSHTVISVGGRKCSCGKRGCVEAYCSMTALYKDMSRQMKRNKDSLLWKKIDLDKIDGKELFSCYGIDAVATKVIDNFVKYLGIAIVNVANLLRPDIILLGGAVSAQGDKIIKPLQNYLNDNLFAKEYTSKIQIKASKFFNDAGIIGASVIAREYE